MPELALLSQFAHLPAKSRWLKPWLSRLCRVVAWLVVLLVLLGVVLAVLLLEGKPLLDPARKLSQQEIANARSVLDFGMRSVRQVGVTSAVTLNGEELDATLNYLLKQFVTGMAHFQLGDENFTLAATARFGNLPWVCYLNVSVAVSTQGGQPTIMRARLGDANLPAGLVQAGLELAQHFSSVFKLINVAAAAVKDIAIQPSRMQVVYVWDSASLHAVRDLVLEIIGKRRLRHYYARLVEVVGRPGQSKRMALGDLLQPLFALAQARSEDRDPIEENRALLLVLSAYLSGQKTAPVLAAYYGATVAERRTVLLNNRLDLAKHFVISAALVAAANGTVADLAGLAKEIDDSHGGSGFNFQDLAADMAGQRFGQLAVASEKSARYLQDRLSRSAEDSVIMPKVRDLPENLDAETFASRYENVDSPAFALLERDIEQRLDSMGLYWGEGGD